MPTKRVWVTPDILLTHNGVTVYFTYQNNDIDHPVLEHMYTVSGSDDSRGRFDVRALDVPSSKLLDMHPPYLTALRNPAYETATEAQRAEWKRQWHEWLNYGGGHEQAIHAVIREAIDLGLIVASPDDDQDDTTEPTHSICLLSGEAKQLNDELRDHGQQIVSLLDAQARWGNCERLFAFHEQADEPHQVKNLSELANYTPERLLALPALDHAIAGTNLE